MSFRYLHIFGFLLTLVKKMISRGCMGTPPTDGRGVCGSKVTGTCYLKEGARNFLNMVTVRDDPSSP